MKSRRANSSINLKLFPLQVLSKIGFQNVHPSAKLFVCAAPIFTLHTHIQTHRIDFNEKEKQMWEKFTNRLVPWPNKIFVECLSFSFFIENYRGETRKGYRIFHISIQVLKR